MCMSRKIFLQWNVRFQKRRELSIKRWMTKFWGVVDADHSFALNRRNYLAIVKYLKPQNLTHNPSF